MYRKEVKVLTYWVTLCWFLFVAVRALIRAQSEGMTYEEAAAVVCLVGVGNIILGVLALALSQEDDCNEEVHVPGTITIGVMTSFVGVIIWFFLRCERGACTLPTDQELRALIPAVLGDLMDD